MDDQDGAGSPKARPPGPVYDRGRLWVLYDGRSRGGVGCEDATVLVSASSEKEARKDARMFPDSACYSHLIEGDQLIDDRWEWDTL